MSTIDERVAALEARIDAHAVSTTDVRGALAELQAQMNRRFEQVDHRFEQVDRRFEQMELRFLGVDNRLNDLQAQMNQRFDSVDQKIDRHFTWLVGMQVAVLVAVVGALVGSYYR